VSFVQQNPASSAHFCAERILRVSFKRELRPLAEETLNPQLFNNWLSLGDQRRMCDEVFSAQRCDLPSLDLLTFLTPLSLISCFTAFSASRWASVITAPLMLKRSDCDIVGLASTIASLLLWVVGVRASTRFAPSACSTSNLTNSDAVDECLLATHRRLLLFVRSLRRIAPARTFISAGHAATPGPQNSLGRLRAKVLVIFCGSLMDMGAFQCGKSNEPYATPKLRAASALRLLPRLPRGVRI
jgi:hypothetical protein